MKPLFKYHVELELTDKSILKSWGVCSVGDSNILDGIYDPDSKHLRLLINSTQESIKPVELPTTNGKSKIEYRKIQEYYRMIIPGEDIPAFLDLYVDNNFEFTEQSRIEQPVFSERKLVVEEPIGDSTQS
jgi:hypothetical protein